MTPNLAIPSILHVTNGDSVAHGLRQSGVVGANDAVLPWRDVLHDGQVPTLYDGHAFRSVRAMFLASRGWTTIQRAEKDLADRDRTFGQQLEQIIEAVAHPSNTPPAPEIVLWFEPDLYDQLQLLQVLCTMANHTHAGLAAILPHLCIVPAHDLLGTLAPSEFAPLYAARRPLTLHDFAVAQSHWEMFTADTADAMNDAMDVDDSWPYLAAAMQRMCEEYPSMFNGLSRSEQQVCTALQNGPVRLSALFRLAHHAVEKWPWLGDSSFAWYVERLSKVPMPLVTFAGGAPVEANQHQATFWSREVILTPFGASVLAGNANAIDANGIDRWIGGVHLTTENTWRWNGSQLVRRR